MEQEPTLEQTPKSLKELQLTEEELTLLDGFDEATEEGAAARDAWMQAHGLEYGDDVVVKNEGQSDRVYTTDPVNFFDRKTEDTLLRESSSAASRMIESTETYQIPEVQKASEELRIEASEDLGEEAVEQLIEEPENDTEITENSLSGEDVAARVKAAEFEFLTKEGYTRSEMWTVGARELSRLEEENGNLDRVVNSLKIVPDLKAALQSRVNSHSESLQQMNGRSMDAFDPNRAFARQVEEIRDQMTTVQRALRTFSLQSVSEISSSQINLTEKVRESIAEVELNRANFESVIGEIEVHSAEGQVSDSLENKDELHNKLAAVMEPIGEIADNRESVDAKITDELYTIETVLRGLTDIYDASIRGNKYDPDTLSRVYASLDALGGVDTAGSFVQERNKMEATVLNLKQVLQEVDPQR